MKHHNKIIKKIEKVSNIEKRKKIIFDYTDRFNKTSSTHMMNFNEETNFITYWRFESGLYSNVSLKFDLSPYLDLKILRDKLIDSLIE